MTWHNLLLGLGYAAGALLLALIVIVPTFGLINVIYDNGSRIIPLLVVVVVCWLVLARVLAGRKVRL